MNPLLESAGQIAAIIICLFVFVFIILAVAFNLAMAFGMSWLEQKVQAIKMLRPTAESVAKVAESALVEDTNPDEQQNNMVRAVSTIPATVHTIEKRVDQGTGRVTDVVIEFCARTVQVKTIVKAFFLPGLMQSKSETVEEKMDVEEAEREADLEAQTSGYHIVIKEKPETSAIESLPHREGRDGSIPPQEQVQHAAVH